MYINSTLHECACIFTSATTMHLQADKINNIKYIIVYHIPIFVVQEITILKNSLTVITWVCQKYDKVDPTYIKNEQYTHSEVSAGICSN
jgi:hypothetical protein